jgi:hypothetical protein
MTLSVDFAWHLIHGNTTSAEILFPSLVQRLEMLHTIYGKCLDFDFGLHDHARVYLGNMACYSPVNSRASAETHPAT